MRKLALIALVALLVAATVGVSAQPTWKPSKPITIIVPWGAGGSTDQITRVCAAELETARGLLGDPVSPDGLADLLWAVFMLPEFQLIR